MVSAQAVRFVLVRPRNPHNLGAAARALANFGFSDLIAVDPHEPVWKEAKSAVGGEAVLDKARALTLDAALGDRHLVLGTHDGRRRDGPTRVDLPELAAWLAGRFPRNGKLAILFGPEKTGLDNAALGRCHAALRIPTDAGCPSMNLAQAVAVVAYELGKRTRAARPAQEPPEITDAQREDLVSRAVGVCRKLGYRNNEPERIIAARFRRLLLRRPLQPGEAASLQALLKRLT